MSEGAKTGLSTKSANTSKAEADGLFAGECVEVAADGIHLAGDVLGGAGTRALEEHVFDEMRNPVGFGGLAAGAGLDPYAHGHRTQVIHALGQDNQAVWQYGSAEVSFSRHRHQFDSIVGQRGLKGTFSGLKAALNRNPAEEKIASGRPAGKDEIL